MISLKISLPLILICSFYSCGGPKPLDENFEMAVKNRLGLKFIASDTDFLGSRTQVFKDTLVGFSNLGPWSKNQTESYHYIVPLKAFRKIKIPSPTITHPSVSKIDTLNNGKLYFGRFGRSTMQTLSIDGTLREYFKKYDDSIFYALKIMLYKKLAVISSMNGVYVLDVDKEDLLWKNTHRNNIGNFPHSIVGNNLIFQSRDFKGTYSLNLDKIRINWGIDNTVMYPVGTPVVDQLEHTLVTNSTEILYRDANKMYLINASTGKITWQRPFDLKYYYEADLKDNDVYLTFKKDSFVRGFISINTKTNKTWKFAGGGYYFATLKNDVIAFDFYTTLWILDRETGKLKSTVHLDPNEWSNIRVLNEDYLLLNKFNLYRKE